MKLDAEALQVQLERCLSGFANIRKALGLHRDSENNLLDEIAQLKSENASLWALATFGRFCVEAINKYSGPTDNFSIQCFGRACESGLIKMAETGSATVITETPLAKLPEQQK